MSVKVAEKVGVNVLTMTANFVTTTVFNTLFRIVNERGLSSDYIYENRNAIERGLFTWVSEQSLTRLVLEVFSDEREEALELFEFEFFYSADPNMDVRQPPIATVSDFCRSLKSLPKGVKYRIIASLTEGASVAEGWASTTPRRINAQTENIQGTWGFGHAEIRLTYRGGASW